MCQQKEALERCFWGFLLFLELRKEEFVMMKKIFCGLMASVLLIGLQSPVPLEAAGKFVFSEAQDSSVKVKGAVFTAERYQAGPGYSKIIRKKDGKSTDRKSVV